MQSSSSKQRIYISPPITEATIELRVKKGITLKEQEKITTKLKKFYPNLQKINETVIGQNLANGEMTVSQLPTGYRLVSDNQAEIVIVQPLSFAVARLAPYPGWDECLNKFVSAWKIWKGIIGTSSLARIGIRYINRIDIPTADTEKIDIESYLNFYPIVPAFSDAPMTSYFIQATKPTSNSLWTASITSTIQPSPLINNMSFLLNIDVFRTEDIPLNDDDLWIILNDARKLKNEIFQQCITPRVEELLDR